MLSRFFLISLIAQSRSQFCFLAVGNLRFQVLRIKWLRVKNHDPTRVCLCVAMHSDNQSVSYSQVAKAPIRKVVSIFGFAEPRKLRTNTLWQSVAFLV